MKKTNEGNYKNVPPMLKGMDKQMELEFDYEINSVKLDNNEELNSKMYYYDKKTKTYRIVNYNSFWDSLNLDYLDEKNKVKVKKNVNKAWCLKRLVSKKKRRFENELFDLDMAYVTKRVIAMGYPSTGWEKVYRNSIDEVIRFFHYYHNDNVKIYNLCIEKDRIYDKSLFNKSYVGLFPAKDHNPCPIKLILEFCVDICLYLIKNPEGVSAVHCKAGKGRTGVMICSYLIFSGLCKNSDDAFAHYAASRTFNKKGVTIPSQIRYIQYFESFLETNFCPPYIFLIPKIVKYHLNTNTKNVLKNFISDKSYFISPNEFMLKNIRIGPLSSQKSIDVKICDFIVQNLKFERLKKSFEQVNIDGKTLYYFKLEIADVIKIDSDIKISVKGGNLDFYFWANLWYSTLNLIKSFLDNFHKDILEDHKTKNINRSNMNMNNANADDTTRRDLLGKNKDIEMKMLSNNKEQSNSKKPFNVNDFTLEADFNKHIEDSFEENEKKKTNKYENLSDSEEEVTNIRNKQNSNKKMDDGTTPPLYNISEPNESDNLFDIIYKLKHNTDMNILIKTINKILVNDGKTPFDKSNLKIVLGAKELDKFSNSKTMNPNFSVNIGYSLFE